MRMLMFKLKSSSSKLFLIAVEELNDRLRNSHGFISGIILSSENNPQELLYLNMWMDADSAQTAKQIAESHFRQISLDHELIEEDHLSVELSITSEGDFKPVVN